MNYYDGLTEENAGAFLLDLRDWLGVQFASVPVGLEQALFEAVASVWMAEDAVTEQESGAAA